MRVMMKNRFILSGVVFGVLVLSLVLAAVGAPTVLTFEGNTTALYDEGNFSLNWTEGAGDAAANYTVFIYVDEVPYTSGLNDSATGYAFDNGTQANYTFIIEAVNVTGDSLNSSNISLYVDATAPVTLLPEYTNGTHKKNTELLTLNVSVADALSGLTGSACLIDVNGTNQTVTYASGWCNSSAIALTGLADGNHTISAWVNDTVGVYGLNNSFVVSVDTTAPVITFSCSPTSVEVYSAVSCACSGTDATAGVSTTTFTAVPATSVPGTFSTTCTIVDNAGNSGSSSASYTVAGSGGDSSSSSSYTSSVDELSDGYNVFLNKDYRVSFDAAGQSHSLKVNSVSEDGATITITSDPIVLNVTVGETKKVDLDLDGFYDLDVYLKKIVYKKANFVLTSINEKYDVIEDNDGVSGEAESVERVVDEEDEEVGGNRTLWIVVILVLLVLGVLGGRRFLK